MKAIIERFKLTEKQVLMIVMEWYTNGMCPDIFQNEDGIDLEEWIEKKLYEFNETNLTANVIKWAENPIHEITPRLFNNLYENFRDFNLDQLTWKLYSVNRRCGIKTWQEFVKLRGY